jgi:hypothetical protein
MIFFMGTRIPYPNMNCHPDWSVPGFPATLHYKMLRVRLSVKKGE